MRKASLSRLTAAVLSLALLASLLLVGALPAAAAEIDPAKTDVWDFGAQQLDESAYNNLLSVNEINSWYPADVAAGTNGNTLPSFQSATGLSFNDGGKPNTHRIRTVNEALTRKDEKSLVGEDGVTYNGYIYSNSGKNPDVYVALELNAGDKVTVIAGSNGKESLITFEGPNGVEDQQNFTNLGGAQTMVFYPRENGTYKLWSATEKLVIARIYRERAQHTVVSGVVTQPKELKDYKIAFTNTTNGAVTAAQVGETGYSAELPAPFTYDISLLNANGYVVKDFPQLALDGQSATKSFDLTVEAVPLVTVTGKLQGLSESARSKLELTFHADTVYIPQVKVEGDSYTATLAKGDTYTLGVAGVNDFNLTSAKEVSYTADAKADITFTPKPTYKVTIDPQGVTAGALKTATFTFTNLNEAGEKGDARLVPYNAENVYPYTYTFTGADAIKLRDGVYDVKVTGAGADAFTQKLTSNLTVGGADVTKTIPFAPNAAPQAPTAYKATLTVGADKDYKTVSAAVAAVRTMDRPNGERVTIAIDPGNYEEMLVVDVPNVTLKNAGAKPSLELMNKGVDVTPGAVRVTHYYGCGYNYYSMNDQCKYDPELLAVNKENGYESFVNPGDGVDNDSYWNSTVLIKDSGFRAEGIIFENSFNQYVSPKSVEDVIVPNDECKEDKAAPRAQMKTVGDTTIQDYTYKERAGALSITDNCKEVYFENCKFIGRQDTLYGGDGVFAAFYDCDILGSTDYIYGPMTAVFAKCDLIFNTSEHEFDRGYITAPRHTATRGFLMYNCTVSYTTPGVDTASTLVSKAGYFGRPWQAQTGEAVFAHTVIEPSYGDEGSMILPEGWFDSLSGKSPLCGEYATTEAIPGLDNSPKRVTWAQQFDAAQIADGTAMDPATWLNGWDAFAGKNMAVSTHTFAEAVAGTREVTVDGKAVKVPTLTMDGVEYVWIRDAAVALNGTAKQFNVAWDNGVALVPGAAYVPSGPSDTTALTGGLVYTHPTFATTVGGSLAQLKAVVFTDAAQGGYTCYRLTDLADALGVTLK